MVSCQNLSLSLVLPYAQAGIEFRLTGQCQEGTATTVDITVVPHGGNQPLALRDRAVPVLEDFAPGFARWLRTCRIEAEIVPAGIRGQMPADATATQVLGAMSRASDMIDQRFSLYTESILE